MSDTHNPTPPAEGVWVRPETLEDYVADLRRMAELEDGRPDGAGAAMCLRAAADSALREATKVKGEG